MALQDRRVHPVILSGGTGSRLWPLSREAYPKQLLPLIGTPTLLQQTAARVSDRTQFESPTVIASHDHRFIVAEQLRTAGIADARLVLEPVGRNTAPAAAVAALLVADLDPEGVILLMPADHAIGDAAAFVAAVEQGMAAAHRAIVLFGITPDRPATGYGYMRIGPPARGGGTLHRVESFVEKPDSATAEAYVASGRHLWNSGIVLVAVRTLIDALARLQPDILSACRGALDHARRDLEFLRLDEERFAACPAISLDHAVLEHADEIVAVPSSFDWSDIGSWSALWELENKDAAGNVVLGDAVVDDCRGCYVRSEGPLVATLGLDDVVVVAMPDAILVAARSRDQDVKRLVEQLGSRGRPAATQSLQVHRPWGFYQPVHEGERFQVKRITVRPGARLSLQKHFHRAEHWVVVNGTALVTRDGEQILLRENESLFIPLGAVHRLENPGKLPLNLIEVQSGAYLGEDDIVRLEDDFARA